MPLYGFYSERQREIQGHVKIVTEPGSKEPIRVTQILEADGIDEIPESWTKYFVCEVDVYIGEHITDPEVYELMHRDILAPGEIPAYGSELEKQVREGIKRMATLDTLLKEGVKPRRAVLAAMGTPIGAN